VAFLDDDVEVARDWPRRICEPFADSPVGLACGPSLVPEDLSHWPRWAGLALSSPAAGYVAERYRQNRSVPYPVDWDRIIGCNAVYRRTAFVQMGGFPPDFYPGEEMIAAFRTERLGWGLRFLPEAKVWHYPRSSPGRFWKQVWGYGATRIRLLRGGVSFHPAPLVPGVWVAATLILAAVAPWFRTARWLLAADLAAYALVDMAAAFWTVLQTRRISDFALLFMIPLMHIAYGLAEWAEFFCPGRDFSEARRPGS
jgi:GT2 family glycosyltransferase